MKIANIKVGDKLQGHADEDMEHPFVGTVEKIYTNSVLIDITDYDQRDAETVTALNPQSVVAATSLTTVAAT